MDTRAELRVESGLQHGTVLASLAARQLDMDERERVLIETVVTLARMLRDERDRLTERLRQVELELSTLVARLDACRTEAEPEHVTD